MYKLKIFIKNKDGAFKLVKELVLIGVVNDETRENAKRIAASVHPEASVYIEAFEPCDTLGTKLKDYTRGVIWEKL